MNAKIQQKINDRKLELISMGLFKEANLVNEYNIGKVEEPNPNDYKNSDSSINDSYFRDLEKYKEHKSKNSMLYV